MKFQVGDTVLLLHSNEEGEVVDIINDKMVMINIKGVIFPAYIDQVDFPYFKRFTEKPLFPAKKEKQYIDDVRKEKPVAKAVAEDGVWLTFLPVMKTDEEGAEIVDELKLHLDNRTSHVYHFEYEQHFFGKPDFLLDNQLHPFDHFYLHDIAFADLNDSPAFTFIFSLVEPDSKKAGSFSTSVRLKPKQLFDKIKKLKENNEATFSYRLFETYPDYVEEKPILEGPPDRKPRIYDAKKARQHIEPARDTIDLHVEKLSKDWRQLSNFEILSLQLKTFEKYYDLAIIHFKPSLTVVHGIGEGKLRDEIHEILRTKKEVSSFVNQYHPRFGYGATEIFFRY